MRLSEIHMRDPFILAVLFRAIEAPWALPGDGGTYITDGPFVIEPKDSILLMLWSSTGSEGCDRLRRQRQRKHSRSLASGSRTSVWQEWRPRDAIPERLKGSGCCPCIRRMIIRSRGLYFCR